MNERFGSSPTNYLSQTAPFEIACLEAPKSSTAVSTILNRTVSLQWVNDSVFAFSTRPELDDQFQALRAGRDGKLLLWRIPTFDADFMKQFNSPSQLPLSKISITCLFHWDYQNTRERLSRVSNQSGTA